MGSLVGQTEERTRQALRIADAMAPCIVFVDEIEKALSGVQASGQTDSGVSARLFGTLLELAQRPRERRLLRLHGQRRLASCRPSSPGPSGSTRSSSSTCPGAGEGGDLADYLERFGLDPAQQRPGDRDLTGAEIRACCRLAGLLDVPLVEAAANIVPVAVTAGESVERLRNWASGRCLSADRPGIYSRVAESSGQSGRKVHRGDTSLN